MTTEFRPTRLKQACTSFSSLVNITNVNQKYGLQSILTDIYMTLLCLENWAVAEMYSSYRFQ